MNNEKYIEQIAELLYEDKSKSKKEKLIKLLLTRNKLLLPRNPEQNDKQYANTCIFPTTDISIPEGFRAYHSGPIGQKELVNTNTIFEDLQLTNHLFFTLSLEELVGNYLISEHYNDRGIYIADVRTLKDARIQHDMSDEVIWNDKIRTLADCLKDPNHLRYLQENPSDDLQYVRPLLQLRDHEQMSRIRETVISEINAWVENHTISFEPFKLSEYREKGMLYVLIPQPIGVVY